MPITHDGAIFYSAEEVKDGFVPKAKVEKTITTRLSGKDSRIAELEGSVLELSRKVQEASPLTEQIQTLQQQLAARDDRDAFRAAGLLDDKGDVKNAEHIEFLKMAHRQHVAKLENAPEDAAAHFRSWLTADDGAKASPYVGHLLKPAAAAEPAPAPAPAADPAAAAIPEAVSAWFQSQGIEIPGAAKPKAAPVTSTGTIDTTGARGWTNEQRQAEQARISAMRRNARTPEDRTAYKQALAAFQEKVQKAQ